MPAPDAYVILPDELVPAAARLAGRSVAGCLADLFDLPHPALVYFTRASAAEHPGDVHLRECDLDVDVHAAITPNARDTIWLGDLHEAQLVRAVAHEIGHIAELLGYVPEGDGVEAFPRQLANAVGATYTAGIGWVDRLLDSSFYLRALSEGRCGSDLKGGWGRGAYWSRLARTRGTYVRSDAPPPAVAALGGPALPAVEEVGVEARVDPVEGAVRPARLIAVPFNRPPGTGRR